ncbi:hypothetical protein A4G20_09575 [Pasteurellaceae bacterium RH1A]|nr:hypothetical protein A4G20_09575 [Pasteurellaceae bacterium RH1A]
MKKIALIALAALLGACSSLAPQKTVSGTFKGVLPCADCEKIQAELILNPDNTYVYNTVYFKNKKQEPFTDTGSFSWDKNKENVISLDENAGNLKLQVNDTYVEVCDANGNVAKSTLNYKLQKVTQ